MGTQPYWNNKVKVGIEEWNRLIMVFYSRKDNGKVERNEIKKKRKPHLLQIQPEGLEHQSSMSQARLSELT